VQKNAIKPRKSFLQGLKPVEGKHFYVGAKNSDLLKK
jgi:hypothetical protein